MSSFISKDVKFAKGGSDIDLKWQWQFPSERFQIYKLNDLK